MPEVKVIEAAVMEVRKQLGLTNTSGPVRMHMRVHPEIHHESGKWGSKKNSFRTFTFETLAHDEHGKWARTTDDDVAAHELLLGDDPVDIDVFSHGKLIVILLGGGTVAILVHLALQGELMTFTLPQHDILVGAQQPRVIIEDRLVKKRKGKQKGSDAIDSESEDDEGEEGDTSGDEETLPAPPGYINKGPAPNVFYEIPSCWNENGHAQPLSEDPTEFARANKTTVFRPVLSFFGDERVFVVADFNALTTCTVISSPEIRLSKESFSLETNPGLARLLLGEKAGPAMRFESDKFLFEYLDHRREDVVKQAIADGWSGKDLHEFRNRTPVKDWIAGDHGVFEGFGEQMANQFCHLLGIHPLLPVWEFCTDEALFRQACNLLRHMAAPEEIVRFKKEYYPSSNHWNPFHFRSSVHRKFMERECDAYFKASTLIPLSLYVGLHSQGLLDPDHIIGEPYDHPRPMPVSKQRTLERRDRQRPQPLSTGQAATFVPNSEFATFDWGTTRTKERKTHVDMVRINAPGFSAFTCIQAKPPWYWMHAEAKIELYGVKQPGQGWNQVWSDARDWGFQACIGPEDFHYKNANRLYADIPARKPLPKGVECDETNKVELKDFIGNGTRKVVLMKNPASVLIQGRNPTIRTGRPGRPAKARSSSAELKGLGAGRYKRLLQGYNNATTKSPIRPEGTPLQPGDPHTVSELQAQYNARYLHLEKTVYEVNNGILESTAARMQASSSMVEHYEKLRSERGELWTLVPSVAEIRRRWPARRPGSPFGSSLGTLTPSPSSSRCSSPEVRLMELDDD